MTAPQQVTQLVAVGASAGGVETLSALVATLPANFPAPIVVAQHLDPGRASHLQPILERRSALPVRTVVDHEPLEPGVIYVVPADRHISLDDHHLSILQDDSRPKPSINLLFRSAAQVFGEGLVAVVLSGLGSDGADGARSVKEAGGTVVIQNPLTAAFPSMPESLAPTTVDAVVDIEAMGTLLYDLLTGAYTPTGPRADRQLREFLTELRDRSGVDFSRYKEPTIQRRLQRRLMATGARGLDQYRKYLRDHPEEYDRLINAFLIKVTEFFRDPELFTYLRSVTLPALVTEGRARGQTLRLWSAGCATGEEAYSLALLVAEALGDELQDWTVRIFATDLDGAAVDFARRGVYPASALAGLPPELVARYCVPENGAYSMSKAVRGLLVFGEHDLGQRPPFPHIDLCVCRNVLIYFTPELQQRALTLFAFALRDRGYLVLGKSETANLASAHFVPVEPALRLYQRSGERMLLPDRAERLEPMQGQRRPRPRVTTQAARELTRIRDEAQRAQRGQVAAERLLLRLPIGIVVVDRHYDVLRLNGMARRLLGITGEALGEDLIHQARGLRPEDERALRAAIDAALRGETRTLEALPCTAADPGTVRLLNITCQPVDGGRADMSSAADGSAAAASTALLVLTDVTAAVTASRAATAQAESAQAEMARLAGVVAALQESMHTLQASNEELASSNALLRSTSEEYVLSNEEVQAAAEEVETLNEELQASNEEVETLNEEQQATNEELETTNEELRVRHLETLALAETLAQQRQRLAAILDSMSEAVVVLDKMGHTVFSNAPFATIFGSSDAEIFGASGAAGTFVVLDADGRPLPAEARPQARARQGTPFTMEFAVEAAGGQRRWYEANGRPIRTPGAPEGAESETDVGSVLVLHDITDRTIRRLQDSFLALASHELKTPLTAISGYLELLIRGLGTMGEDGAVEPRRLSHYAQAGRSAARQLQRLVDDLLDASRLETGKLRLDRAPMDLAAVVAGAVETARLLDAEHPLDVALENSAEPLRVDGDAARIEQVVLNLLINARVHAPGAAVTVRLRRAGAVAELEVHDSGPGIDAAALPLLFTRFYQAPTGTSPEARTHVGMGLGLYIAHEIVVAHGGRIAVESAPGQGTTFRVQLPLLAAQPTTAQTG